MSKPLLAFARLNSYQSKISNQPHPRSLRTILACALLCGSAFAGAQVEMFGGNAQHTNLYTPAAQEMNKIRWQTSIDTTGSAGFAHYGEPLITATNVVITPVVISGTGVQVSAFNGTDGTHLYDLSTDWVFAPHGWIPVYQPCLHGSRLYYAGAGGTIYYVDGADTATPTAPTQLCFFGLANYQADPTDFNNTVFVDTPITADSAGNIYFGFRVANGTAPAPLNTTESGYAKIDASGNGTYVLVDAMTGDVNITRDCHNTAPALSNDESKLYVVAGKPDTRYYGYLVALNTSDLSTSSEVFLKDPRNGNNAGLLDDGTSSPMVAPDGDVFLGVFANPYNGSRGFLAHFSGDLSVTKPYGGFGWDFTPGIVPASMVPSYNGPSSYLLFCKYNNYDTTGLDDGDGVNRVAILDPNSLQTDIHPSSNGLQVMRDVETVIGFTPDPESFPNTIAVREMCVNASAVNPATDSVFFNSEDGHAYRWNLASNQVTQSLMVTPGVGEPYVPSEIGPDGTIYTLNGGMLFAMGAQDNDAVTLTSSSPDSRTALTTDSITFTAHVNTFAPSATNVHSAGVSTDQVTFTDSYFDGFNLVTNPLGTFPLDGSGNAQVTTALSGGTLGNHFITAQYSGNLTAAPGSVTLVQKVHSFTSTTALQAVGSTTPYGQPVVLTATVTPNGTTTIPTGQVTFLSDGKVIGQVPLDGTGTSSFTTSSLGGGLHNLEADYQSDTWFASSSGTQQETITDGTTSSVGSSPNPSTFGQNVTFTATITAADSGAGTPTGSVVFTIDGTPGSPVTVDGNGQAQFSTTSLSFGSHTVSAAFTGTNGWADSSGTGADQSVIDGTNTSVGSSPNPSTLGQTVTFTATITAADTGAGTPAGSVVFTIDGVAGSPITVDGSGQAQFTSNTLTVGSHTVSAAFTGTGGWGNSSGSGNDQVVNPTTDTTPPSIPQIIGANPGPGKNKITISWQASTDPDDAVDHYEIWRANKANGNFNLIATTSSLSYMDNVGNKQTRFYFVVAVDTHGNRSGNSDVVSGTSPNVQGPNDGNGHNGG